MPEALVQQQTDWLLGLIITVDRLIGPKEHLLMIEGWPAWYMKEPVIHEGKTYVGVYDYCLKPLPDEEDVLEFDTKEELKEPIPC